MEWKGLSKSVNAEKPKGYHVAGIKMMTNAHRSCFSLRQKKAADREGRKRSMNPTFKALS